MLTPGNALADIIFLENASHPFMGCSRLTHKLLIQGAFVSNGSSTFGDIKNINWRPISGIFGK